MNPHIAPVDLAKAYRLLNHGPTVLVSARHAGEDNVMAAAWACVLDFSPPKVTVVLDKATRTRQLIEASGRFALWTLLDAFDAAPLPADAFAKDPALKAAAENYLSAAFRMERFGDDDG